MKNPFSQQHNPAGFVRSKVRSLAKTKAQDSERMLNPDFIDTKNKSALGIAGRLSSIMKRTKRNLPPSAAQEVLAPTKLPREASVDSETVQHKLVRDIMHPDEAGSSLQKPVECGSTNSRIECTNTQPRTASLKGLDDATAIEKLDFKIARPTDQQTPGFSSQVADQDDQCNPIPSRTPLESSLPARYPISLQGFLIGQPGGHSTKTLALHRPAPLYTFGELPEFGKEISPDQSIYRGRAERAKTVVVQRRLHWLSMEIEDSSAGKESSLSSIGLSQIVQLSSPTSSPQCQAQNTGCDTWSVWIVGSTIQPTKSKPTLCQSPVTLCRLHLRSIENPVIPNKRFVISG